MRFERWFIPAITVSVLLGCGDHRHAGDDGETRSKLALSGYVPVINLGSTMGFSYARDINNSGVVVGSDQAAFGNADGEGPAEVHGFRWTEAEGMVVLPGVGPDNFPRAINDAGVVAGTAGTSLAAWLGAFRYDPAVDTQFRYLAPGPGTAINAAGVMTGYGYFPDGMRMFRVGGTGPLEELPTLPGPAYQTAAIGNAIDDDGTVVGWNLRADGMPIAIRYTDARGTETLNSLIPDDPTWLVRDARSIKGNHIVGWGYHNGLNRAFRMTVSPDGGAATIDDLGLTSNYPADSSDISSIATKTNAAGEIVGGIFDKWPFWSMAAFLYVDGVGMIDLNTLIDPQSGWLLTVAFSINDHHQVVGNGYLNGQQRAFLMTVPDLRPCPAPTDTCRAAPGVRDPATGACTYPTAPDGTACDDGVADTVGDVCSAGVCAGTPTAACAGDSGASGWRNLARCQPASQSSDLGVGFQAGKAIDGNVDADVAHGSVSETVLSDQPYWQVDLGKARDIDLVRITPASVDALSDFYLFTSEQPFQSHDLERTKAQPGVTAQLHAGPSGAAATFTVTEPARYVRIQMTGQATQLALAEVEVLQRTNLAEGLPAYQSSTFVPSDPAGMATDGDVTGDFIHTALTERQAEPWWEVDLGSEQSIGDVVIWNRTDCCQDQLHNMRVYVSDVPLPVFGELSLASEVAAGGKVYFPADHTTARGTARKSVVHVGSAGRFVRVMLEDTSAVLQIAEVEVKASDAPLVPDAPVPRFEYSVTAGLLSVPVVLPGIGTPLPGGVGLDLPIAPLDKWLDAEYATLPRPADQASPLYPGVGVFHPDGFTIHVDACKTASPVGSAIQSYWWILELGDHNDFRIVPDCAADFTVPKANTAYALTLMAFDADGRVGTMRGELVVQSPVIASMGDSIASGEGNPDVPMQRPICGAKGNCTPSVPPIWEDRTCHRSRWAGPVQAAAGISHDNPHMFVRFASVACSGSGIRGGIAGGYDGQEPPAGAGLLPSQIDQIRALTCPPGSTLASCRPTDQLKVDALLLTTGANEVPVDKVARRCGFPDFAGSCADDDAIKKFASNLNDDPALGPTPVLDLYDFADYELRTNLALSNVYITEYPDPTHGSDGSPCAYTLPDAVADGFDYFDAVRAGEVLLTVIEPTQWIGIAGDVLDISGETSDGSVTADESAWAFDHVIHPLNRDVHLAANRHGWTAIGAIESQFFTHGICASDPWSHSYADSMAIQGSNKGYIHPTLRGHWLYGQLIRETIEPSLRAIPIARVTDPSDTGVAPPNMVCTGLGPCTCADGFGDCDGRWQNGCEVDLRSDAGNCGSCGYTCGGLALSTAHTTWSCSASTCSYTCEPGFGDCDRYGFDGCETDTSSLPDILAGLCNH
jgi:uncharacterized membrane protein